MKKTESLLLEFYVYGLIDPRSDSLFYIGKGKGKRAEQHFKETIIESQGNHSKILIINELKELNLLPKIKYFITGINEEAALYLEEILIDRIGRQIFNYGPLTNLLVGGIRENKLKIGLTEEEKITVDFATNKYPFLKEIIENVPRTTKEDLIKHNFNKIINEVSIYISSVDSDLFENLKVEEIKYLSNPWGKGIQFDCKFGKCEILIKAKDEIKEDSIASIYIRKDDNIIFETNFYSTITESIFQLNQFNKSYS